MLTFLKNNWVGLFVVCLVVVGCAYYATSKIGDYADMMHDMQVAHEEELQKVAEAREEERRQHEENIRELEETLVLLAEQYDAAKKELDEKKKRRIEDIVQQHGDDPKALADELAAVTGLPVMSSP